MTSEKLKAWAPGLAIVFLFGAFLAAEYLILPSFRAPTTEKEVVAPPAEEKTPASAPAAPAVPPASPAIPASVGESPAVSNWNTFHGGSGLTGHGTGDLTFPLSLRWQYLAPGPVFQPPVGDESGIYLATTDGHVVSLDFTGAVRWSVALAQDGAPDARESIEAAVAVHTGLVLVGTQSGRLHALDAATGAVKWVYDVGGQILAAPNADLAANSAFVLERANGILHGVDLETGAKRWQADPIARCDGPVAVADGLVAFGSCLPALHVFAVDGKRVAEVPLCGDCQVAGGVALASGELYTGNRGGQVLRADARDGQITWNNTEGAREIFTTPAIGPALVVAGDEAGRLRALDRATGAVRWAFDAGGLVSSAVIIGNTVAFGARGTLSLLDLETGAERWKTEVSDNITTPAWVHGLLLVASEDGTVSAFAPQAPAS